MSSKSLDQQGAKRQSKKPTVCCKSPVLQPALHRTRPRSTKLRKLLAPLLPKTTRSKMSHASERFHPHHALHLNESKRKNDLLWIQDGNRHLHHSQIDARCHVKNAASVQRETHGKEGPRPSKFRPVDLTMKVRHRSRQNCCGMCVVSVAHTLT